MAYEFRNDPKNLTEEYELIYAGLGKEEDFAEFDDLTGKVAFVKRGDIPFVEKIANAKEKGAEAIIIYNHSEGISGYIFGGSFDYIPTFELAGEDGKYLEGILNDAEEPHTIKMNFSDFQTDTIEGDDVTDFSSRGPVARTRDIKPDICAPGYEILSTLAIYGKENKEADYDNAFVAMSGTSMACPHVAGIAALLVERSNEQNLNLDPFDIKTLMMNNSKTLDFNKYDLYAQGAGRVDALQMINAKAIAQVIDKASYIDKDQNYVTKDNITGSINFGIMDIDGTPYGKFEKTIKLKNLTNIPIDYSVEVELIEKHEGITVSVDKPSFTLENEETFKAILSVDKNKVSGNEEVQGLIKISDGETTFNIPFVASIIYSSYGITVWEAKNPHFSPNGDGIQDEVRIDFSYDAYIDYSNVMVWSPYEEGPDGDGYLGVIYEWANFEAGFPYRLIWEGDYYELADYIDGKETNVQAKDGFYVLEMYAVDEYGNSYEKGTPIIIKTVPANIITESIYEAKDNALSIAGTIEDLYIELKKDPNIDMMFDGLYTSTYTIQNNMGQEVVKEELFVINQDGTFNIDLANIPTGTNKLVLNVLDKAGNIAIKEITIKNGEDGELPTLTNIIVDPSKVEIGVNNSEELTVMAKYDDGTELDVTSACSFESNNPEVANVSEKGVITGLKEGIANISVSYEGKSATVEVNVTKDTVIEIAVDQEIVDMLVGAERSIKVTAKYEDGTEEDITDIVDYIVLDNTIVSVEKGVIRALKEGETSVKISYKGKEANVRVQVAEIFPMSDIPGNSVVVNNKAYDIRYLNNNEEAQKDLLKTYQQNKPIYVILGVMEGTIIVDLEGYKQDKEVLGFFIYHYDKDGRITKYMEMN